MAAVAVATPLISSKASSAVAWAVRTHLSPKLSCAVRTLCSSTQYCTHPI